MKIIWYEPYSKEHPFRGNPDREGLATVLVESDEGRYAWSTIVTDTPETRSMAENDCFSLLKKGHLYANL